MYLFYGLFVMLEIIHLPFGPLTELLKDLSPPGCRLGWGDRQTHGLDGLDQSWEGQKGKLVTDKENKMSFGLYCKTAFLQAWK